MKVCILTHTFPQFKGDTAAPFMEGLAKGIQQAGNEVFVLIPYSPKIKKESRSYHLSSYKYIYPPFFHMLGYSETLTDDKSLKFSAYILSPFLFLFGIIALYRLVKREHIDIINAYWILPNGFIGGVVSMVTGVPLVSSLPGSDILMARKNILFSHLAKFAFWSSKAITSNSTKLSEDLGKIIHKKVVAHWINYGVDTNKFLPNRSIGLQLKKQLKIPKENHIILSVGRLVEKKGFSYVIEAAAKILKKHKNVSFVIVGSGDQEKKLKILAERLGISNNIMFVGVVNYDKLLNYYNMGDISVLASLRDSEGNIDDQSLAIVEAMACGKPVITTDFPGYKSFVKDGNNGFLVPEKNAQEIAKKINILLSSKTIMQKMGKASRQIALKQLTWNAIGSQYSKLFKTLSISKPSLSTYSKDVPRVLDEEGRKMKGKQIMGVLDTYLSKPKSLTCLDVGCSDGTATDIFRPHFKSVWGIDLDEEAIKGAQKKYKKNNVKFAIMDGEHLKFAANSFDVVILNQVYEFTPHPKKLIEEVHRVLKKGGICFIGARNKWTILEGQSRIPLIHFLPTEVSKKIAQFFKGEYFPARYMSLYGLQTLFKNFDIDNLTIDILKNPRKYKFHSLIKYETILKFIPKPLLDAFVIFIPNYILVCKKT